MHLAYVVFGEILPACPRIFDATHTNALKRRHRIMLNPPSTLVRRRHCNWRPSSRSCRIKFAGIRRPEANSHMGIGRGFTQFICLLWVGSGRPGRSAIGQSQSLVVSKCPLKSGHSGGNIREKSSPCRFMTMRGSVWSDNPIQPTPNGAADQSR